MKHDEFTLSFDGDIEHVHCKCGDEIFPTDLFSFKSILIALEKHREEVWVVEFMGTFADTIDLDEGDADEVRTGRDSQSDRAGRRGNEDRQDDDGVHGGHR